jgi:hypothetical protein
MRNIAILWIGFSVPFILLYGCTNPPTLKDGNPNRLYNPSTYQPDKIMTLSELEILLKQSAVRNQKLKGYGKTVFEGTKIEKFEIEVVDILKKVFPKQDLILIKCKHPILDKSKVIAGMSGSPIYVQDRVIGALAYGWGFTIESIAGVTPIEYMLENMQKADKQEEGSPMIGLEEGLKQNLDFGKISMPVVVSGFHPKTIERIKKFFGDSVTPVVSGSGSAKFDGDAELLPGAAIGARLMGGDYEFTAIGTVTYRDDDKVLAFGHPFLMAGRADWPITSAVVHTIMMSQWRSFKLSSPLKEKGSLLGDRANSIYGRLGKKPRMIPVKVTVKNPKTGNQRVVSAEVIDHRIITPILINWFLFWDCIDWAEPSWDYCTLTAHMEVDLAGGKKLFIEDVIPSNAGANYRPVSRKLIELIHNEYQKPVINSIDVTFEVIHENRIAHIKNVWLDRDEVEDGSIVGVNVLLKRFGGEEVIRRFGVRLPRGLKKGQDVKIHIGGGSTIPAETAPASNLDEFLENLQKYHKANTIVAVATVGSYNLRYKGKILDRLPNSWMTQILPTLTDEAIMAFDTVKTVLPMDFVVLGSTKLSVRIK